MKIIIGVVVGLVMLIVGASAAHAELWQVTDSSGKNYQVQEIAGQYYINS